jgi:TetR/AcrR family transcriptional regulator, lmrAB and yxaGH operons repressor
MARLVAERADILPVLAELFREHGFEGASLSLISDRTGLGKGSLYHFFPGGKEEMAAAVLAEIDGWFEANIFRPLREAADPLEAVAATLGATEVYFRSGRRVCLVGVFALSDTRDRFAQAISGYFAAWRDALADALARGGQAAAQDLAEAILADLQGGLVLARALDDPTVFQRAITRSKRKMQ